MTARVFGLIGSTLVCSKQIRGTGVAELSDSESLSTSFIDSGTTGRKDDDDFGEPRSPARKGGETNCSLRPAGTDLRLMGSLASIAPTFDGRRLSTIEPLSTPVEVPRVRLRTGKFWLNFANGFALLLTTLGSSLSSAPSRRTSPSPT